MYKHLEKERVEEELPFFSMLVMKCSAASPILKHCAKHVRRIMSILWKPWLSYSMRSFFLVHEILSHAWHDARRGRRRWTILQFFKSFPHVYEYHLQCIFTFVASIFLQLLLVQSHGPNHCFTSASPPSISRCPIAASSSRIFLSISRIEHVLKHCSIAVTP